MSFAHDHLTAEATQDWAVPTAATAVSRSAGRLTLGDQEQVVSLHWDDGRANRLKNTVAARLVGAKGKPVIAIMGGISAGRFVTSGREGQGWWNDLVGADKAIDTNHFQILSFDFIGPSNESATSWPNISTSDQAFALSQVQKAFSINRLHTIVGASYGGMVGLKYAEHYPHQLGQLYVLCAAHKPNKLAQGWRTVQRHILQFGLEQNAPERAIAIARELAMVTYRSADEFEARFGDETDQSLEGYLKARGNAYSTGTSAARYGALSQSIDDHRVSPERINTPTRLAVFSSDQIATVCDMTQLQERMPNSTLNIINSHYGHDGFLKEIEQVTDFLSSI